MAFRHTPRSNVLPSLADVTLWPFWLDRTEAPVAQSMLVHDIDTELLIVGAGFTGLWTALQAIEEDPSRDIVIVDASESANAASGRNGGFVHNTLTHGFGNGHSRWPEELATITRMGNENLHQIAETVERLGIDCDWRWAGELEVASEPHEIAELRERPALAAEYGENLVWLDRDQTRARLNSPTFEGSLFDPDGVAMVDPARLAWGLKKACLDAGVRIFENSEVLELEDEGGHVVATTPMGSVRARKVALATNAFRSPIRAVRRRIVPVYDYVLTTEPLTDEQWASLGWDGYEGISDAGNQFHYYRRIADGRILWGGYDAIYHSRNGIGPQFENDPASYGRLADHFFQTFPQLAGIKFSHAWGGAIDTCSRFSAFWGTTHGGKTAYVAGFTGLGVGASRFGGRVMLDFLDGKSTERTQLKMVRTKPMAFPPEPLRSIAIALTRWSLDRSDRNGGKRNIWLKVLDRFGLGFDS
jgi:glycine/D-amino acid oxidase-like deaminating enzyme